MILRYALLLDHDEPPAWAHASLKKLGLAANVKLIGYLQRPRERSEPVPQMTNQNCNFSFRQRNEPFESPCGIVHTIAPAQLYETLKTFQLDFVINFWQGSDSCSKTILAAIKFGVWRFQFGTTQDASEIGIAEIFYRKKIQHVSLIADTAESGSIVLKDGNFKVRRHSIRNHQACILKECEMWILSAANEISNRCDFNGKSACEAEHQTLVKVSLLHHFVVKLLEPLRRTNIYMSRLVNQFYLHQWNVGIIGASLDKALFADFSREVNWWSLGDRLTSHADPFPIIHNDELFVMAESFGAIEEQGRIQSFGMSNDGEWLARDAIQFPHHLSYPCIVSYKDEIFATFEALDSNELAIYRCVRFPDLWTRHSLVVKNQCFADPTLFRYEGRWWVFATEYDLASEGNSNLHAWFSEDGLNGPWIAHIQNPIKSDVGSARSAGSPFFKDGILHRPSQNCADRYGKSLVINRISLLSPEQFVEVRIQEILPTQAYPNGIHHFAGAGSWTAIDGRRDEFSLKLGFLRIIRKLFLRNVKALDSWRTPQKHSVKLVLAGDGAREHSISQ